MGFTMRPIPAASHEFTVDWLNSALAGSLGSYKIVSADSMDSDIPGQTAEIARISVTYDSDECPLPMRFVAKYTCKNRMVIEGMINAGPGSSSSLPPACDAREVVELGDDPFAGLAGAVG